MKRVLKKMFSIMLTFALVIGVSTPIASAGDRSGSYEGKTVIIYTGNLRGDVDVYAKVATAKKDFAAEGATVYLVDAGNYLQGSTFANSTRGEAIYDLMDAAGYDVAAMGAYEFAYEEASTGQKWHGNFTKYYSQKMLYKGQGELEYAKNGSGSVKGTLPEKAPAAFKVISSNISGTSAAQIDSAATSVGNPEEIYAFDQNASFAPDGGLKVGFVAVTDTKVPDMIQDNYFNGLSYNTDSVGSVSEADVTVALSNDPDTTAVDGAAFTICAPTDGEELAGAKVIDNESKVVSDVDFNVSSYDGDAAVASKVTIVKDEAKEAFATSKINFVGKNSLHRSQETTMGDLVTDALLWYAESGKLEGFKKDVPVVAIQNGGNVRESLFSGDITELDLFHSYPYSPAGVGILYVTGEQLLESLEESTQLPAAFPHVAGMTYNVDMNAEFDESTTKGANGDGKYGKYYYVDSVNRVTITSIGGKEFDPKATYAVVADNMVIFNGLDTYGTFKDIYTAYGPEGEGSKWINNGTGILTRNVVALYLKDGLGGVVPDKYADTQGRITFRSNADLATEMIEKARIAASTATTAVETAKKSGSVADAAAAVKAAKAAKIAAEKAVAAAKKAGDNDLINSANEVQKTADKAVTDAEAAKTAADKAAKDAADKAAAEAKAKKVKTVTVNVATVNAKAIDKAVKAKGGSKKYVTKIVLGKKVKKISKSAFKKYAKVTTLEVKTKKLKKASIKKALTGSKVKTVKVKVGSKKLNKKYVKKYKKIFTKKNAGKKVTVK